MASNASGKLLLLVPGQRYGNAGYARPKGAVVIGMQWVCHLPTMQPFGVEWEGVLRQEERVEQGRYW